MIRYVIIIAYVLALCLGVVGATMAFLANRKAKSDLSRSMEIFSLLLLAVCLYDMFIYFTNYIVGYISGAPVLRIGDCIISILVFFWINTSDKFINGNSYSVVNKMAMIYCSVYSVLWIIVTLFLKEGDLYTLRWFLLITDVLLVITLLVGSITYLGEAVWSHQDTKKIYYLAGVTALMAWNYIAYFWGETSVYWGNSGFIREPLDLTIFFWLLINVLNIIVIFTMIFRPAYLEDQEVGMKPFDLEESLETIRERYDLTARETDLVRLLYEGKSNSDIANLLFISESTVKTHLYNIFRKLGVKNRIEVTCIVRGDRQ